MSNLSYFFKRSEFACPCCGQDWVDYELLLRLNTLRSVFNAPVTITSGNRCCLHNLEVGGSGHSQHLLGKAADIVIEGVAPGKVYDYLNKAYPNKYGLGLYEDFTHFDVRENKARW